MSTEEGSAKEVNAEVSLKHFCTYTVNLNAPDMVGRTFRGQRYIVSLSDGRWEGPTFAASQRGPAAADWLTIGDDGTAHIDVRMTLRTDDKAFIYVEYEGRADWSGGVGSAPGYSAPRFETDHPDYAWMNSRQFLGKGGMDGNRARYEIYLVE